MSELQGKSKTIFMSKKEHKRVDDEAKIHLELWGLKFMKIKMEKYSHCSSEHNLLLFLHSSFFSTLRDSKPLDHLCMLPFMSLTTPINI